jgi:hypothetical protein
VKEEKGIRREQEGEPNPTNPPRGLPRFRFHIMRAKIPQKRQKRKEKQSLGYTKRRKKDTTYNKRASRT